MNSVERERLAECERRITKLMVVLEELREELQWAIDRVEELEA